MSWRDEAPQSVQDDVDNLLDAALTMSEAHLRDRGAFFPFGLVVDRESGVQVVDVDVAEAKQAKTALFAALARMRGDLRAVAVVTDVALPETGSSGIEVHLEHTHGIAIGVLEPYGLSGGELTVEPLEGHTAVRAVW
ncbi:hypothetical protein [Nocardia lasii]|uniref:Uncharacterized protein n=1 Tax=Nocardia lasii TaxID=1616107 RepID=A0ABW1JLG6_9NOCA